MNEINSLGVVGAGTMGHGIAQVAAQAGLGVVLVDVDPEALERGMAGIGKGLDRLVKKEKMTAEERDAVLARVTTAGELSALSDADLVVEAVVEKHEIKSRVLADLDGICGGDAILASNTSSISITRLAASTG